MGYTVCYSDIKTQSGYASGQIGYAQQKFGINSG